MIDEKRLEREYRKLEEAAAPDLWDRIENRLEECPGREPFAESRHARGDGVAKQGGGTEKDSGWTRFLRRYGYGLTAAAAAIAVTAGLNTVRNSGYRTADTAGMVTETTAAATSEGAAGYKQLSVSSYTALPIPEQAVTVPEDTWYFSEAILEDTELLCGAEVGGVSFEYDSFGNAVKVVYDLTIEEIYYAEDYAPSAGLLQVKSPIVKADGDEAYLLYQLQEGSTYLLPLKKQEGAWELLYPFAPQVQVLKEGGYLFHSGYASLMDSRTLVVVGQQEAANDYYYDRMLFRDDTGFLSDFLSLVEH